MVSLDDLRAKIALDEIRSAFEFLVETLPFIPDLRCEPGKHGWAIDLRVLRGSEYAFSVTPAAEWLLIYIRKPELQRGRINLETTKDWFPEASQSRYGEITFRLRDERMARKLVVFIAWVE